MPAPSIPLVAAFAATFLAGLVMLVTDGEGEFAVAVIGAVGVVVTLARSWTLRTGRAFVHGYHAGYHAGYHDGSREEVTAEPCDVIELASSANDQLRRLPA